MTATHAHAARPVLPGATAPATEQPPAAPRAPGVVPVLGLVVGHVHDPAEAAADARAEGALARLGRLPEDGPAPDSARAAVGLAPGPGPVRRAPTPVAGPRIGPAGGVLDAPTTARIEALRRRGTPLPGPVRGRMEHAFGARLGQVRVHDGPEVARLNAGISAQAFTTGNDIFLGGSGFAPAEPAGERVLAHEIAHVLDSGPSIARLASATVRRFPEKRVGADADADYTDHSFPDLRLKRVKEDDDVYEIRNPGLYFGRRIVWMENCDYYPSDEKGSSVDGAPKIDLAQVIAGVADPAAAALVGRVIHTDYPSVGETGTGLANVTQRSRLHTFGLISCVAWVLYNARAAYMTHIVVGDPLKVSDAGIADQVNVLVKLFTKKAGSAPTHVKIVVNAAHLVYRKAETPAQDSEPPPWMGLLVPPDIKPELIRGQSTFEHEVVPGPGPGVPTHWEGPPIKLVYNT